MHWDIKVFKLAIKNKLNVASFEGMDMINIFAVMRNFLSRDVW